MGLLASSSRSVSGPTTRIAPISSSASNEFAAPPCSTIRPPTTRSTLTALISTPLPVGFFALALNCTIINEREQHESNRRHHRENQRGPESDSFRAWLRADFMGDERPRGSRGARLHFFWRKDSQPETVWAERNRMDCRFDGT